MSGHGSLFSGGEPQISENVPWIEGYDSPSWPCDAGRKEQSILRSCRTLAEIVFAANLESRRSVYADPPASFFGILGRNSGGLEFMCRWVWIVTPDVSECQNPPNPLVIVPEVRQHMKQATNLNGSRLVLGGIYETQGEHLANPNYLMFGQVSSTTTTTAACCPRGRVVWLEDSSWRRLMLWFQAGVCLHSHGLCTLFVQELWMIHSITYRYAILVEFQLMVMWAPSVKSSTDILNLAGKLPQAVRTHGWI